MATVSISDEAFGNSRRKVHYTGADTRVPAPFRA